MRADKPLCQMPSALAGLLLAAALLTGCGGGAGNHNGNANGAAPVPAAASVDANQLIKEAMANMAKVKSYHAKAELAEGEIKYQVEADVGEDRIEFTTVDASGGRSKTIGVGKESYVSTDDGNTWRKDPTKAAQKISQIIVLPAHPKTKMDEEGPYKAVGNEDVEGMPTVHIQAGAESEINIWIGDDPQLGKVIRKIRLPVALQSDDGEIDATVVYSDFNKPVNINPPR